MKNTTVDYTDEPMQIGKVAHDLFPKDAKLNFQETRTSSGQLLYETNEVNVTFNKELLEQLKNEAASQQISVSALVEQLIIQGLTRLQTTHMNAP